MEEASITIDSRLPASATSIFTVISKLSAENKAINLGQGYPDFECDERLKERVGKYLNEGKNQYSPLAGVPQLLETLSHKIERCYQQSLDPTKQVCITSGATQALFTAIMAFVKKDDEVIIFEPAYDCYRSQILLAGGVPKPYNLVDPDYSIDWNQVKDMVTERTRMIIINTPHNPSGTILQKEDLLSLQQIVADKNIIVLSDEVYEHLVYDGQVHESVIKYPSLFQQSMAVFSFGKTLHATGWKLGYIVGPEHLIQEFKKIHQWNVFCSNSFLQFAIADYLKDPQVYETLPPFFEEKRDLMTELLRPLPITPRIAAGTYFQLYNYEQVSSDTDIEFVKFLTKEIGVAAIPLSPFYTNPPGDKVVRLCFAKKQETLEAAAERLQRLA